MSRTLADVVRSSVIARSRARGEAAVRRGRVTLVHATPTSLSARVRGSTPCEVSLTLADDMLQAHCTCPVFENSGEPCEHIWAAVLKADAERVLEVPQDLLLDVGDDTLDAPYDLDIDEPGARTPWHRAGAGAAPAAPPRSRWESFFARIDPPPPPPAAPAFQPGSLIYVFDPVRSTTMQGMLVELLARERRTHGGWTKARPVNLSRGQIAGLPDARDRHVLERICGAQQAFGGNWDDFGATLPVPPAFVLTPALQRDVVPALCATERFFLRWPTADDDDTGMTPIVWDAARATFRLHVTRQDAAGYLVDGVIDHNGTQRPLSDALFLTGAVVVWRPSPGDAAHLASFETTGAERWLAGLVASGPVLVPPAGMTQLVEAIATSDLTHVDAPDELRVETRREPPTPIVRVNRPAPPPYRSAWRGRLDVTLAFAYGQTEVSRTSRQRLVFDRAGQVAWRRDDEAERAALQRLGTLGVRNVADRDTGGRRFDLADAALPALVRELVSDGWRVEAEGRLYRRPGASSFGVSSGIDWFELRGEVAFDGHTAQLPALVAAARRGETFVRLGDGSFGLLPDEWLSHHSRITALGASDGDHVRFSMSQTALLDAWLAQQPTVTWDDAFASRRAALARFEGVAPEHPPASFKGELRDYQCDALGWFAFLRRFGFGGCLADEMGLGKTVMVLAALEARRVEREADAAIRPSLIVVPRSLVFNWLQEARRFAPALRVLDATGHRRDVDLDRLADHDVVIATYGTLRRDIGVLKDVVFDYAILDEAQAIKNPRTASARAARLLNARHRLGLSGTPIENHLGELWSLFEFLNPGMLGSASAFGGAIAPGRTPDADMTDLLGRGLRPFILRRTKEQVASELPARTEQTLFCDLEPAQRRLYDGLRARYRAALLGGADVEALGGSKLQVLEALLRLRQAACHPGLVDAAHADAPSAKLDLLLPRLQELVEDGRKVLVFSQFTSLLALLRPRLDAAGLTYEYLDGRTRDREARVRRFQGGDCPLFLISLKAGGLGLNLTAADYVFLLDPWWNPAVEAQAIDRAHRIGQTRAVFAYRLIARDTVEAKVLELQATKRQLADAVVRADAALLRDLRREDLELLLS